MGEESVCSNDLIHLPSQSLRRKWVGLEEKN